MPSYKVTTYPILNVLLLGPDAFRIIDEAKLDAGVGHLIRLESLGRNYVKITCRDDSKTVFVIQDSSLVDLLNEGGPDAYLEYVSD
jgi:hypothetical protein